MKLHRRAILFTPGAIFLTGMLLVGLAACAARKPTATARVSKTKKAIQAEPEAAGTAKKFRPFFAWCWSKPDKSLVSLSPMLWVRNSDYRQPATMARDSRRLPSGRAAIFLWNSAPGLLTNPMDTCRAPDGRPTPFPSPWLSAGAKGIGKRMAIFFHRFKAAGGRMDYLVLDYEAGLSSWQISRSDMKAIERDPRSAGLKKKIGFPYLSSVFFAGPNRRAWNLLMGSRVADALNTAFFDPARASFPTVSGSNFGGVTMTAPYIVPDLNGHYQALSCVFGNCQSPAFYGTIGGLAYASPGGQPYGNTPFAILRYEMMYLQGIQSTSRLPVVPWVAYQGYAKTAGYYKELVYQLAMRGINQFLYWNPRGKGGATASDDVCLNECLTVLRRKLGGHPGMACTGRPLNWNSGLLVAARRDSTGRVLYRVTVPPGTASVEVLPGDLTLNTRNRTGRWILAAGDTHLSFRANP